MPRTSNWAADRIRSKPDFLGGLSVRQRKNRVGWRKRSPASSLSYATSHTSSGRTVTHSASLSFPRDHLLMPPGMRPELYESHSLCGTSTSSGFSLAISSLRSAALKDDV